MENKQLDDLLEEIKVTTGKDAKQTIVLDYWHDRDFRTAIEYLLNPFMLSGVSESKLASVSTETQKYDSFADLVDYLLVNHHGTEQDIAYVNGYLSNFDGEHREFMQSMLTKTAALGIGTKSVNDALGEKLIPEFSVQLAYPYQKKIKNYPADQEYYVTQKLDGHRALTIVEFHDNQPVVTTFTRTGQIIDGLDQLQDGIVNFVNNNDLIKRFPNGLALDGELLLKNDEHLSTVELFQATSLVLRRLGAKNNLQYNVFDMVALDEFFDQWESTEDYTYRREHWLNQVQNNEFVNVIPVLAKIKRDEIPHWSHYATKRGWEGVMLNTTNGHYRKNRTPNLLKVKKMHTADLPIIGYTHDDDGYLQTVNVQLSPGNIVPVGSGFTEELRHEIDTHQEKYMGVMVEIQYFEFMKRKDGTQDLRFPVFKDFRFDKTPDDINIE